MSNSNEIRRMSQCLVGIKGRDEDNLWTLPSSNKMCGRAVPLFRWEQEAKAFAEHYELEGFRIVRFVAPDLLRQLTLLDKSIEWASLTPIPDVQRSLARHLDVLLIRRFEWAAEVEATTTDWREIEPGV